MDRYNKYLTKQYNTHVLKAVPLQRTLHIHPSHYIAIGPARALLTYLYIYFIKRQQYGL